MRSKTKQRGFTLVEVMVVVAIIAILAGFATPTLLSAIPNMRLRSAARDIYSIMMQTKVEAIRRGECVTLSFNSPLPGGSPGGTYTMFVDNGAGVNPNSCNGVIDAGELVLISPSPLPDRVTFDPVAPVDPDGNNDGVSFAGNVMIITSRGLSVNPGGGFGAGTVGLRAVDANGNTQRQRTVTVSSAGRIRIQ